MSDTNETGKPRFFADWIVKTLPEDLDDFHISAGIDSEKDNIEDQVSGYFPHDKGSTLAITRGLDGLWQVRLSADTQGLEMQDGYWLSPSLIDDEIEAVNFGMLGEDQTAAYAVILRVHDGRSVETLAAQIEAFADCVQIDLIDESGDFTKPNEVVWQA